MSKDFIKIRISAGELIAMGPGKADLLASIDACGSISAAAKQMGMSYRRAWELVDVMNRSFKEPLVKTYPGGAHGGGAQITDFGFLILKNYRILILKVNQAASSEIQQITQYLKTPE